MIIGCLLFLWLILFPEFLYFQEISYSLKISANSELLTYRKLKCIISKVFIIQNTLNHRGTGDTEKQGVLF